MSVIAFSGISFDISSNNIDIEYLGLGAVIVLDSEEHKIYFNGKIGINKVSSVSFIDDELEFTYTDELAPALKHRSELGSFLMALVLARQHKFSKLLLVTDSTYSINVLNNKENKHYSDLVDLIRQQIIDGGLEIEFQFQELWDKKSLSKLDDQERKYAQLVFDANYIAERTSVILVMRG